MDFDLENPLPTTSQDHHHLFQAESDHMPLTAATGLDPSTRRKIISTIQELSCNFDPFLSYLAINYLDRFLSTQSIPVGKPWMLRLLAVSCVSLALKMRKSEYSVTDIQNDGLGCIIFDTRTIQRMELLILGALKWRMRSITPFGFINLYITLFKFKDPPSCKALKERATEIIFTAQNGSKCLEFKPSIVAASALLFASHELFPLQFLCYKKAITNCSHVDKDNVTKCYNVIQDIAMEGYESVLDTLSSSSTPVNVLDMQWSSASGCRGSSSSSDAEKTATNSVVVVGDNASATIKLERDLKRRKITCFGRHNNNTSAFTGSAVLLKAGEELSWFFLEGVTSSCA